MGYITENEEAEFVAFLKEQNRNIPENRFAATDKDITDFFMSRLEQPGKPIHLYPDSSILNQLGVGAVVAIRVSGGSGWKTRPFIVTLCALDYKPYCYYTENGMGREGEPMFPDSPMVHWDYSSLPPEMHADVLVRDPIRTWDTVNGAHIVAIYSMGKRPVPVRNVYADDAVRGLQQHLDRKKREQLSGLRPIKSFNPHPYAGHHAFNYIMTEDEPRRMVTAKGIYNGDVFELAQAILSRRPSLVVPYHINEDLFVKTWLAAERPGRVGDYVYPWEHEARRKNAVYTRVNAKSFTAWVLRAYPKFLQSKKLHIAMRMQHCRDCELTDYQDYIKDAERDARGGYSSVFDRDEDDDVQEVVMTASLGKEFHPFHSDPE